MPARRDGAARPWRCARRGGDSCGSRWPRSASSTATSERARSTPSECFKPEYGLAPTASNVYGVLSLIVWSLILIVSVKYLVLIIRLDNRGEGGIMALLALVLSIRRRQAVIAIGLFGAALLYGDGIITPAISV